LELLSELRARGVKTAIASASKNASEVVKRLQLDGEVDVVVDGGQVENTKPAPDLFLLAARQVGEEASACVVVEDAQAGIQAALAAGMRTIGIGPDARVGAAVVVLPSLENQHLERILAQLTTSGGN